MILIIDDDIAVRTSLELLFNEHGYTVTAVDLQKAALVFLQEHDVSLVILDLNFSIETSGREGMQLLQEIRRQNNQVPVILITGWGSIDLA
ncbi:MAG: response regulator, partial [Sphingobacteriales bacterium]